MAFSLALAFEQGTLALALLAAASLAAELPVNQDGTFSALHQLSTLVIAALLSAWCGCRRHFCGRSARLHASYRGAAAAPVDVDELRLPDRFVG